MKGMIYRDLLSMRAFIILSVPQLFATYFFMFYIAFNETMASQSPISESEKFTVAIIMGIISFLSIVCFPPLAVNSIHEDKHTGWSKFCRCIPHKKGDYTKAKIISTLIIEGVFVTQTLIVNLVGAIVFGSSIELALAIPFAFSCFTATFLLPTIPLTVKWGKAAEYVYMLLVFVFAISLGLIVNGAMESNGAEIFLRLTAYLILPSFAVVSAFLSYKLGKKMENVDL